jgi:uncharacterized ferritin-like protein (DUF455 family)
MRTVVIDDTKVVRGTTLRRDPAREPCFEIVHLHEDVPDDGGMGPEHRRQRLHREVNQEIQTLEIAALCLSDFPDAPWDLRLELARQCWDEARHTALIYRRLLESGGWKGQYPIANLDWSVVAMLDSLPARLAIQHRTFESGSLDIEKQAIPMFREVGDDATADVMEAIEADEIPHVRFANEWLTRLTEADPRAVLQVASAIAWLRRVVVATGGKPLHGIATDGEARRMAGFSTAEIAEVKRQEERITGAPLPGTAGAGHE